MPLCFDNSMLLQLHLECTEIMGLLGDLAITGEKSSLRFKKPS